VRASAFGSADSCARAMQTNEHVVALRYVAVTVVKDTSGTGVYSFVFHLRTDTGTVYSLGTRYSVLRRLSLLLQSEKPDVCATLPPFPSKYSMSRQTPQFLLARGKALEAYLSAALGTPDLSALPAVRQLLRAAELHHPAGADRNSTLSASALALSTPTSFDTPSGESVRSSIGADDTPPVLMSRESSAEMHAWQKQQEASASARRGAVVSPSKAPPAPLSATLDAALHPIGSLALTISLGYYFGQVTLCAGCCVLGLATGRVFRSLAASDSARSGVTSGAGSADGGANGGAPESSQSRDLASAVAPELSPEVSTWSVQNGGGGGELEAHAVREAVEAVRLLTDAVRDVDGKDAASGWKHNQSKDDVSARTSCPRPQKGHARELTHRHSAFPAPCFDR
jgi:hypothetical protein